MIKSLVFLAGLASVVGGVAAWYIHETADQPSNFRTVAIERGNLLATINATSVTEPEQLVDVGAQINGMVETFGKDLDDPKKDVDYDSRVEVGTILAQIDPALYKAALHQAQGNYDNALAMLEQAKTNLKLSQQNWDRAIILHDRKVMSQADYDSAQADLETKNPALLAAKASVEVCKANLETAQTNLNYCTIKSPVKGVIVDRRVNIGQTVVSSLSAASLFLIARDLTRMQLWVSVNEADIGQIHPQQPVQFTVDAYPHTTFRGVVTQIRLNANMTQNVVTYTVVVTTDNSSRRLLPYMTANVKFEVAKRDRVLLVPSAALRWKPQPNQIVADSREAFSKSHHHEGRLGGGSKSDQKADQGSKGDQSSKPESDQASPGMEKEALASADESASKGDASASGGAAESADARPKREKTPEAAAAKNGDGRGRMKRGDRSASKNGDLNEPRKRNRPRKDTPTVWVEEEGFARPLQIETGMTDGTQVEITGGDLKEGMQVIVGEVRREEGAQTKNPFIPSMFRGRPTSKDKDK
jgi:HlyD family secretion protein